VGKSFNPCCTGSPNSGAAPWRSATAARVFQSLLYWIAELRGLFSARDRRRASSFNPCCTGSPNSGNEQGPNTSGFYVGFQSLLYWIAELRVWHTLHVIGDTDAFQSLLYWIAELRVVGGQVVLAGVLGFQSLLYWIAELRDHACLSIAATAQAFQSLLYWIAELRAPCSVLSPWTTGGFNPCCTGSPNSGSGSGRAGSRC